MRSLNLKNTHWEPTGFYFEVLTDLVNRDFFLIENLAFHPVLLGYVALNYDSIEQLVVKRHWHQVEPKLVNLNILWSWRKCIYYSKTWTRTITTGTCSSFDRSICGFSLLFSVFPLWLLWNNSCPQICTNRICPHHYLLNLTLTFQESGMLVISAEIALLLYFLFSPFPFPSCHRINVYVFIFPLHQYRYLPSRLNSGLPIAIFFFNF